MKVQLLLLLALAGLLCAFTSASPTAVPTELHSVENTAGGTKSVEMTAVSFTSIVTGPLSTEKAAVPAEITTKVFTESSTALYAMTTLTGAEAPPTTNTESPRTESPGTESPRTESPGTESPGTEIPGTEDPAGTEGPAETESPGTEGPAETEDLSSETESPGTEGPAETEHPRMEGPSESEGPLEVDTEGGSNEGLIIDNGTEDGLSSGQIVSIVVGALLAVAITTAVVIVVVRRMGKYSP